MRRCSAVLPATLAERVFLTGYVIGFTLAFRYAVRSVEPRAAWLAVFAIPLTLSVAFAFGLFNYVWSLVPFLVTIGYALRYKDDLRGRHAVVVGVLAALTYLTHLVSFVEVVILIGSVVGTGTLRAMRARRGEGEVRPRADPCARSRWPWRSRRRPSSPPSSSSAMAQPGRTIGGRS